MRWRCLFPVFMLLMTTLACNASTANSPPASAQPAAPDPTRTDVPDDADSPGPPTPATSLPEFTGEGMGNFRVAILIDLNSEPIDHEAARAVVQEASDLLRYQTGFTIDVSDVRDAYLVDTITGMAAAYLEFLTTDLPHGLVIFSYGEDDRARQYGGYVSWVAGFEDFHNEFVSPIVGDQHVYLAVMHWGHRFGECGYGGSDEVQRQTSIGGECRNQPGTACIPNHGYLMCANVLDDLYASTPTYFLAANIVHEFLHPFGTGGNDDHYGTPHCQELMGWTDENWTFSVDEAERFNGQCPNLYAAFDRSYRP